MRSVLFLPTIPWSGDCFQTPNQMARQFARNGWRVYYGNRGPRQNYSLMEVEENLFLVGNFAKMCNKLRKSGGVDLKVFGNPKSLRRHPSFFKVPGKSMYCMWDSMPAWVRHEAMAKRSSDFIVCVSHLLRSSRPPEWNMHTMPNAVEADKVGRAYQRPKELERFDKPIVSFIGYAKGEWVSQSLLNAVAEEFQLVMIGPADKVPKRALHIPILDHNALGGYYQYSDCTLVPFRNCETARMCSPIKMFESLAAGTPVVVSNVQQADIFCDGAVISSKASRRSFVNDVQRAVDEKNPELCIQSVKSHTWELRFSNLLPRLESIL